MGGQQKIESQDITLMGLVREKQYLFQVPNYQRNYVWTEKEVQIFLRDGEFCWRKYREDLTIFEHFAGQLILRLAKKERDGRKRMEIIDGQQRITTFLLLVAEAVSLLKTLGLHGEAENLKEQYLVCSCDFAPAESRLQLSKVDQKFWEQLSDTELSREVCKPRTESHKHLKQAAEEIGAYLESLTKGQAKEEISDTLEGYIDAMARSFRFVLLKTDKPGYMYALYQIVNDRGLPLTSGELLRARTMELLGGNHSLEVIGEQIWDDILQDTGAATERYLSWSFTAVFGKKTEKPGKMSIHEQYEREVFRCYNKRELPELEQKNLMDQLQTLHYNVTLMRNLEKGVLPADGISNETRVLFEALVRNLKNTFCIPLFLKVLDMDERVMGKTLENLTPVLAKTFFLAKTMAGVHDEVISRCYLDIWQQIGRNSADMEKIRVRCKELLDKRDCWRTFGELLKGDIYSHGAAGNVRTRFLLVMREFYHGKEVEAGCKECGDDSVLIRFSDVSVEHILKDSVDEREVRRELYESREKIGNLTLIGKKLNTRLKNKDFEDKREIYLNSPYWITRQVGALAQWRYTDFKRRQEKLEEDLRKAFEL